MDKNLAKAHELNMEKEVIEGWWELAILVNNLIEGLKNKFHSEALKSLKIALGGANGLNEENSRLARRILRDRDLNLLYRTEDNLWLWLLFVWEILQ